MKIKLVLYVMPGKVKMINNNTSSTNIKNILKK